MDGDGNSSSVQESLIAILRKNSRPGSVIHEELPGRVSVSAGIDLNGVIENLKELQLAEGLALREKATDTIWVLRDGEEPRVFGLRLQLLVQLRKFAAANIGMRRVFKEGTKSRQAVVHQVRLMLNSDCA